MVLVEIPVVHPSSEFLQVYHGTGARESYDSTTRKSYDTRAFRWEGHVRTVNFRGLGRYGGYCEEKFCPASMWGFFQEWMVAPCGDSRALVSSVDLAISRLESHQCSGWKSPRIRRY